MKTAIVRISIDISIKKCYVKKTDIFKEIKNVFFFNSLHNHNISDSIVA